MSDMLVIEHKGLEEFRCNIEYLEKNFPKEAMQMMGKAGNKARNIVRKRARSEVGGTGEYVKSIKRGKIFKSGGNELIVRVYSSSKKTHLIERGHRIVTKSGEEKGFVPGKFIFEKAKQDIEKQYDQILATEFDKILKKL